MQNKLKKNGNHCLHLHVVISGNMHTRARLSEALNILNHSEILSMSFRKHES